MARETKLADSTLEDWEKRPWDMSLGTALVIARKAGRSLDWLAGADVPALLAPREIAAGELSHAELSRHLYEYLEKIGWTASGLSPAQLRILEARPHVAPLLDRVARDYVARADQSAREFVATRLEAMARALQSAAEERFFIADTPDPRFEYAAKHARQLQIVALGLRHNDPASDPVWGYLGRWVKASWLVGRSTEYSTRFRVPGGVAWGVRDDDADEVWHFAGDLRAVVHVRQEHAVGPLLYAPGDEEGDVDQPVAPPTILASFPALRDPLTPDS